MSLRNGNEHRFLGLIRAWQTDTVWVLFEHGEFNQGRVR